MFCCLKNGLQNGMLTPFFINTFNYSYKVLKRAHCLVYEFLLVLDLIGTTVKNWNMAEHETFVAEIYIIDFELQNKNH